MVFCGGTLCDVSARSLLAESLGAAVVPRAAAGAAGSTAAPAECGLGLTSERAGSIRCLKRME